MNRKVFYTMLYSIIILLLLSACASTAEDVDEMEVPTPAEEMVEEEATEEEEMAEEESPAGFDWRMYEGTSLRIAVATQPWTQFLEPHIPEFEELTGIETTYEVLPEDQFRQKTTVEFAAGTSDVDVFVSMLAQEGIKYESAGWYADFEELLANEEIADPNFDFDDFTESGVDLGRLSNGKLVGLPVYLETGVLFYNKDLFEQAGIENPPQTLEEVTAAAEAINALGEDTYGICFRGKGAAATSQFSTFLHTFGSDWVDANGNANVLDPSFLAAVDWYGSALRDYGPPGATSYHWQQCQDIFLQGNVGMWFDASVFFANLVDPEQSTIVDAVGVAPAPVGPGGPDPTVAGWVLSIYEGSENKEAAWLFVQWALGKDMVKEAQLSNIATARVSAWESEEYISQNAYPDVAEIILMQGENGNPNWNPPVLSVGEARDAIGALIITSIEGGAFEEQASDVNDTLQALLDDTPVLPELD